MIYTSGGNPLTYMELHIICSVGYRNAVEYNYIYEAQPM